MSELQPPRQFSSSAPSAKGTEPGKDLALATAVPSFRGRRDPFHLPPPPVLGARDRKKIVPVILPPGPRGLIISQLVLEGIVADNGGRTMIAVVTNRSQRAYFLRDNEMLYDGMVTRIGSGAVYFQERVPGTRGASGFRTVVKRLSMRGESQ